MSEASDSKIETLDDITEMLRGVARFIDKTECRASGNDLRIWADRIDAAAKRERAISNALLAIKGKMIPHPDPENAPPLYPGNAAALRNCDVGTAEEQYRRFRTMCDSKDAKQCSTCMFRQNCYTSRDKCFARWAQLPYEAEKKGGVE